MVLAEKRMQVDYITAGRLRPIVDGGPGPCVSIIGALNAELVRTVEQAARGLPSRSSARAAGWVSVLLQWLRDLASSPVAASAREDGLALFACPKLFRAYRLPFRLPESVTLSSVFHVKPLLPLAQANNRFYLLFLGESEVDLYWGGKQCLNILYSTAISPKRDRGPESFYRSVDAVRSELCDPGIPVVLVGAANSCLAYRNTSPAAELAVGEVLVEYSVDLALFEKQARELSSRCAEQAKRAAADQYYRYWHTQRTSNNLPEIARAGREGRIKVLFVPEQIIEMCSGVNQTVATRSSSSDEDLLSLAAMDAYIAGGRVYAVSPDLIPGHGVAAALFRD